MKLTARLARVEGDFLRRRPETTTFRIFWADELVPCVDHGRCYVEPESGSHHDSVIRLSFRTADVPEEGRNTSHLLPAAVRGQ